MLGQGLDPEFAQCLDQCLAIAGIVIEFGHGQLAHVELDRGIELGFEPGRILRNAGDLMARVARHFDHHITQHLRATGQATAGFQVAALGRTFLAVGPAREIAFLDLDPELRIVARLELDLAAPTQALASADRQDVDPAGQCDVIDALAMLGSGADPRGGEDDLVFAHAQKPPVGVPVNWGSSPGIA